MSKEARNRLLQSDLRMVSAVELGCGRRFQAYQFGGTLDPRKRQQIIDTGLHATCNPDTNTVLTGAPWPPIAGRKAWRAETEHTSWAG